MLHESCPLKYRSVFDQDIPEPCQECIARHTESKDTKVELFESEPSGPQDSTEEITLVTHGIAKVAEGSSRYYVRQESVQSSLPEQDLTQYFGTIITTRSIDCQRDLRPEQPKKVGDTEDN